MKTPGEWAKFIPEFVPGEVNTSWNSTVIRMIQAEARKKALGECEKLAKTFMKKYADQSSKVEYDRHELSRKDIYEAQETVAEEIIDEIRRLADSHAKEDE